MEFTDYKVPYPTLYVINKGETDNTRGTALAVYPPAIGPFASEYAVSKEKHPSKFSAEITKDASMDATALSKRQKVCLLQSGTPKEGSPPSFPRHARSSASWRTPWHSSAPSLGEFSYISGYWEWVDDVFARKNKNLHRAGVYDAVWASLFTYDVDEHMIRTFCHLWSPSTNTLCTSVGEFSISLWDLHVLGGLPLRGLFYDEVVPSAKELTGVDKDNKPFLPRSCQHLFSAYHHLGGNDSDGVQALDWVKFWFKGPVRYREPPQRLSKKGLTKPRLTYNPSGEIHTSLAHDRTKEEDAPFDALGVKEPDRDETYVAALLACWICKFLLPSRNINHIRPGVFKVASMIASGEKFSLAIPVLASIYRGLKQLTSSTDLKECTAVFPIHYVYGWISSYLKTHFEREDTEIVRKSNLMRARMTKFAGERMARKYNLAEAQHIFESIEPSQMMPLPMFREKKLQMLCDSGTSSDIEKDYFICLRSCYLVLRLDKHYIVEFYDPHRFGRQFGFSQDLPSEIRAEQNPKSLEAAMQLWEFSTRLYTAARLALPRSSERLVTKEYLQWWSSHYRSPFKDAPKVTVKLSNGAHDSSKKVQVESKKKVIDPSNDGARNESAIDNVSKTLDVQTAKVKRTMVESSTSESDSNCDRNWKRCKKSQVFDLDSISIDSKTFFGDSLIPNMDLEDLIQYFEILDDPLNQEASLKGKGIEVPVDSTHSSLPQHKEICDDSDRIPLTQVLAQSKKKATSSKIPLHIPSFDNLGVQRTAPSSSKNKEVKTNFEPPARKSPSSVSGFRCKEVVERSQRKVAEIMWSDLVQQFSTTPLEGLLSIKEEVDGILQAMNQLGGMDVSFLHERVAAFLENAGGYADEISSSSQRIDKELFDRQISDASQRLRDMQAQESQHVILSQDHEAKLTKLVEDEDNLKKRLEDILSQKQKMSLLLQQDEKQLLDTQSAISGIENEISVLKSSPPLSEEDFMRQRNLKEKFEADLQELKDFKLFP